MKFKSKWSKVFLAKALGDGLDKMNERITVLDGVIKSDHSTDDQNAYWKAQIADHKLVIEDMQTVMALIHSAKTDV